jgi:hypothetical protein
MTHSYMKILMTLDRASFCYIRKHDDLAMLIRETKLILLDEAPMTNKPTFETMNRTLCDLQTGTNPLVALFLS